MKVSVIVPTYNRKWVLPYTLRRLLVQDYRDMEIIVVDDGSTDGTEKLPELQFVRYMRLPKREGEPFARNRGVEIATGELIVFVDSDVLVDRRFISDHVWYHMRDDKLIVQGLVRHIRKPHDFGRFTLRVDGICVVACITQNMSVRKRWLMEVGGFDESIGSTEGYIDVDMGLRLRKIGLKTVYTWRRCIAYHVDGYPDGKRFSNLLRKAYERGRNAYYLAIKHGNKVGQRFLKYWKVTMLSYLMLTRYWAEKEHAVRFALAYRDSPFIFVTPIVKELLKIHHRYKGIRDGIRLWKGV